MRLIDADRLRNIALSNRDVEMVYEIDHSPTIEERPHGEWLKKGTYFGTCWATCSVCNKVSSGEGHDNGFGHDYSYPNFCPKCGSDNRPRENNSSSIIINGKYSENVEYGTRIEIGEMKEGE